MKTKTKNLKNNNRLSVYTRLFLDFDTICEIADKGIAWNYNRQLCSEAVRTLSEDRVYPVIHVLEHHHRFFEPCETHMRLVIALPDSLVACLGNPDPVGMKVYAPAGEETFDDIQTTEEAQAGADRREAA